VNSYSDGSTVSGWRGFVIAGVLAASCAAAQAHAEVLLDTFGPGNSTIGLNLGVFNNGQGGYFSQAVAFSTPSTVTVDAILAAIKGTGSANFGIMGDAAGLPSNSFLYSVVLNDPVANVSLTGLGWTLGAGTYWLAAVANPGFSGGWDTALRPGRPATDAAFDIPGWSLSTVNPAARITTAVPEPETYTMLLAGLGLLGFLARRRNRTAV